MGRLGYVARVVGEGDRDVDTDRGSDPGRTVAELGTRLTPVQLMERAKETIRKATAERAREVAQSAGEMASEFAQGTRDVAADATDRVRAHPKVSSPRQQVSR